MILLAIRLFAMHHQHMHTVVSHLCHICRLRAYELSKRDRKREKATTYCMAHTGKPVNCDKQDTQSIDVFFRHRSQVVVVVVIFQNGTKTNGNLFCSFLFYARNRLAAVDLVNSLCSPFSFAHHRFDGGSALWIAEHPLSEHDIIKLARFFASS